MRRRAVPLRRGVIARGAASSGTRGWSDLSQGGLTPVGVPPGSPSLSPRRRAAGDHRPGPGERCSGGPGGISARPLPAALADRLGAQHQGAAAAGKPAWPGLSAHLAGHGSSGRRSPTVGARRPTARYQLERRTDGGPPVHRHLHLAIIYGYDRVADCLVRLVPHPDFLNLRNSYMQVRTAHGKAQRFSQGSEYRVR